MLLSNKTYQFYLELLKKHGPPSKFWPYWCKQKKTAREREIIAVGAILTQRTAWRNVEQALTNLRDRGVLSIEKICQLGKSNYKELEQLIRPAGFYHQKTKRLFGFCDFVIGEYGGLEDFKKEDLSVARKKLLALYGIGPETADTILLYALDKPVFVVDEYTKRLVKREKLTKKLNYESLQIFFEANLPADPKIYQDFHALIIIDQKGEKDSIMKKI